MDYSPADGSTSHILLLSNSVVWPCYNYHSSIPNYHLNFHLIPPVDGWIQMYITYLMRLVHHPLNEPKSINYCNIAPIISHHLACHGHAHMLNQFSTGSNCQISIGYSHSNPHCTCGSTHSHPRHHNHSKIHAPCLIWGGYAPVQTLSFGWQSRHCLSSAGNRSILSALNISCSNVPTSFSGPWQVIQTICCFQAVVYCSFPSFFFFFFFFFSFSLTSFLAKWTYL